MQWKHFHRTLGPTLTSWQNIKCVCVCEQEAAYESCHWYMYNLPSNQDELAHQSTLAQAYMEAVYKDM